MATLEKIMHMWEEIDLWWWGWFKEVSNPIYINWLLRSFTWDWAVYNLTYEKWKVSTISSGNKSYSIEYCTSWELKSIVSN